MIHRRSSPLFPHLVSVALSLSTILSSNLEAQGDELGLDEYIAQLDATAKRVPECDVDENGLPKRVLITRNGTFLFSKPESGAEKIRPLALYDRLYLYAEDDGGRGFHRVGLDPFGEEPEGWVSSKFCLVWNHNEMLFLNTDSLSEDVDRIYVWGSEVDAKSGDPEKAIAEEQIGRGGRSGTGFTDVFFPVLRKDRSGTLYEIGYVLGGDQGVYDEYGQTLTAEQRSERAANVQKVNLLLVMDATGSMVEYIDEAKAKATAIVDALEDDLILKSLTTDRAKIELTVNFGLLAYRDKGDAFETQMFVPLTNDRSAIKSKIGGLTAGEGGDFPEMVVEALQMGIREADFSQGALNRIVLIGDAPPHQLDDKVLSEVGTLAKNHHVEIYALVCGDQEITEVTFKQVATSSGGQCFQIADATDLATLIVNQLKERLGGVPIEAEADRFALEEGVSLKESLARLGATGRAARQIQKLLVARGADVAPSGDARTGWVKVRPGDSGRFKIYTYISRWKFAKTLSSLLGLTEKVIVRKDLAEVAPKVVQSFLGLEAGDKATAGIDKTGDTVAKRAAGLPETTKGVERGEKGVVDFNPANRDKILALLDYWKNPEVWEHEYLWIPLELLP